MPNPNAASPTDPQVLTLFQEELARSGAKPGLAAAGSGLWPRFAGYYQGLTGLPRRLRRALQRRWRRSLGGIALLCALGQAPALAATINVGGGCTLIEAITAANNDAVASGCSAGNGADTIELPSGSTHTLTAVNNNAYLDTTGLPVISTAITIEGNGSTIVRDSTGAEFRILAVAATGNLTLRQTTVSGGVASLFGGGINNTGTLTLTASTVSGNTAGASGGGISNSGTLTVNSSTVSGNTATGGGGGGIDNSGTLILNSSTVSGNTAQQFSVFLSTGGGIQNNGTLTLSFSTVSGNTAEGGSGGGIGNSGTLTLTDYSTVSGNAAQYSGGIKNFGALTLTDSTVSGNSADYAGGISNSGTLTFTDSTVSGNTARFGDGGISNFGALTLTNSTVSGNTAGYGGGGLRNHHEATMILSNSTVESNSAGFSGGGISNNGTVTLTNSTVSGNTAGTGGGGVNNREYGGGTQFSSTVTVINSSISGNTAADRGAGLENAGAVTFINSTVTANASGRVAGGLFNTGTVTLVQSLISGNTAPVNGPEAYSVAGQSGPSTVVADGFNVFGHDRSPGIAGFTLGASDFVPADPLAAILDPTLGYNGGATRTHALVFGSPAVDAVLGAACATGTDQRGAPRAQDGDGDTSADCDSGAVERGQVPVQASLNSTRLDCRTATCQVPVTCNLTEAGCTNEVEVTVRTRPRRNSDGTVTKAARPIRFAAGVTNIPPGGTGTVRLRLTKEGKRLLRATNKRRLKGVLGIREIATTVTNTPLTISRTDVTIRLKRR